MAVYFTVEDQSQDLTGCTLHFGLYEPDTNVLVLEKASGAGIALDGPRDYVVDLSDGSSYGLLPGGYKYAVRITGPTGRRSLRSYGPWNVVYQP